MTRFLTVLTFVLVLICALPPSGHAAITPAPAPEKAHDTLRLLSPAAEQLNQQLQSLQSLITPVPSGESAPTDEPAFDPAPNFGTRTLNLVVAILNLVGEQAHTFVTNLSTLPQLSSWVAQQKNDARLKDRWATVDNGLISVILPTALGAMLLELLLLPIRKILRQRKPENISGRIAVLTTLFFLRAVPIAIFIAVTSGILNEPDTQKMPRFILLNIVYALSLNRIVFAMLRGLLAPGAPDLRLFPVTSRQATYAYRWIGAFSLLIIYGYFCFDVARALHVPDSAIVAFANILGIVLVLMALIVIGQTRSYVTALLRRNMPAQPSERSWLDGIRLWLSRYWQIMAVIYLIVGYVLTAFDVQNGFLILLRGTISSLLIIVGARLALTFVARHWRSSDLPFHKQTLRVLARLAIAAASIIGAMAAWGIDIPALLASPLGQRVSGSMFSVVTTVVTLALVYEWINSSIERHISRTDKDGITPYASSRTRTLLPMLRNTIFLVFAASAILVAFSEAGFNIAPLLAGAGVLGVAIGFGSQTLVKDFLTGLFIVAENTIAIGDIVKIGEHTGVVEAMSMRTIRLRDQGGDMHIIPFSEVSNIVNMTKNYSYALIKIGVSYSTDLDHALNIMQQVGEDLRQTPPFSSFILNPIEILGVEELGNYSITLLARLRTLPGKQWDVKRMYQLKIKQRFDHEGIEIPFPTVTNIQQIQKS